MITHFLKILPCYFQAVIDGDKTFEIRDNSDRGFQKGDTVCLQEYDNKKIRPRAYTGREQFIEITYVTNAYQKDGYVVFAFKKIK